MTIRVLIADDHRVLYDGLKSLMEAQGDIQVLGYAQNGLEAVQLVRDLQPDVVVMDIGMSNLNGVSATLRIREEFPSIKVVILSMLASSEHVFQALKAGAIGYVVKEAAGADVIQAVRFAYEGRRYMSQQVSTLVLDDYMRLRNNQSEKSPMERLSAREREVLQMIVEGKSNIEISDALALAPSSVTTYRSRLMTKLSVNSLPELIRLALNNGFTAP